MVVKVLIANLLLWLGLVTAAVSLSVTAKQRSYQLKSPNGQLVADIAINGRLVDYSLTVAGKPILQNAQAQLHLQQPSIDLAKVVVSRNQVNRVLQPHVRQKSAEVLEHYNEINLAYNSAQSISFRLFDQGLAYRFSISQTGQVQVNDETALFNFAANYPLLYASEKGLVSHNERSYVAKNLEQIDAAQLGSLPFLVDANGIKVVITESGLRDYPGMWVTGNQNSSLSATFPAVVLAAQAKTKRVNGVDVVSDRNQNIVSRADYIATSHIEPQQGGRDFPWRIFAVGQTDGDLLTNELSYLLGDELAIDPSWIKPGQVAWDWWNANNLYGVDFKAGINTQTYKYYIDFAAKYGLEYIVLDEGWHHLDNVLNVVDDIDVKAIIDYAKSKNVEVILWVIWQTLDEQMEHALDTYASWGAAGVKVDFMQRDDQAMVNYYWKVAEQAAKRHLLVDFHGSYKPAGLRRAYPNVITREGVRGLEHNKWGDYISSEHNLTLPFIRQLAGPMDYTPGAMVNAQPKNFTINFNRPMSKTTRAHQLAMYVVFESPLQMLADSPSNYIAQHQSTQFISRVPTVWDHTQVLSAKLADHIILARRSGDDWFIGLMGNSQGRDFNIDLAFLGEGLYQMESFADGMNADNYASDYKVSQQSVDAGQTLKVTVAANGGWVARLTPILTTKVK